MTLIQLHPFVDIFGGIISLGDLSFIATASRFRITGNEVVVPVRLETENLNEIHLTPTNAFGGGWYWKLKIFHTSGKSVQMNVLVPDQEEVTWEDLMDNYQVSPETGDYEMPLPATALDILDRAQVAVTLAEAALAAGGATDEQVEEAVEEYFNDVPEFTLYFQNGLV